MASFWTEFIESSERVLLLQGPVGPFFNYLQNYLAEEKGKIVYKINFNGGDAFYSPAAEEQNIYSYTSTVANFPVFLEQFLAEHDIDAVVCFGDGRIYHKLAKSHCKKNGNITFWAFEEGYLRPHFITFEKWGVNYNSTLCRKRDSYEEHLLDNVSTKRGKNDDVLPVAAGFWVRAKMSARYYYEMWRQEEKFKMYQHHREEKLKVYLGAWVKAALLRSIYKVKDRKYEKRIQNRELGDFFVFPLQVHNDNQIVRHGLGLSIPQYIRKVIHSFAMHAPKDAKLVIKHHPMDRGFNNYQKLISRLAKRKSIEGRVIYVHEVSMPDLLRSAKGMVVINSTSGISALIHRLPVKVIGNAHYDIPPLTSNLSLNDFWINYVQPDSDCVDKYLHILKDKTQLNGTFYSYKQLKINNKEI